MKLLLENFKKSMKEQFRGPTSEPGFPDPGENEPEGYDEVQDQATRMVDQAVDGRPVTLPNGDLVTYDDPNAGGGGQFILNQSEVFAEDYDSAEARILNILTQLSESIKNEIIENLSADQAGLAQRRLRGAAAAADDQLNKPAVDRAIGLATKRLAKAPDQQKVEFLLSVAKKLGIEPEEFQALLSRMKTTARKAAEVSEETSQE
jgi:hypothetical protein